MTPKWAVPAIFLTAMRARLVLLWRVAVLCSVAGCAFLTLFLVGHFIYALMYQSGRFCVNVDRYSEGWIEVATLSILGGVAMTSVIGRLKSGR